MNSSSGIPALLTRAVRSGLSALTIALLAAGAFAGQKASASRPQKAGRAVARVKKGPISASTIREIEQALSDLGYWTGPVDGKWDEGSRHALIAFQKVELRNVTGRPSEKTLAILGSAARPEAREGGEAHIEIDLSRQVLFMVDGSGQVSKVLPVSTGSGEEFTSEGWTRSAITPEGRFKVSRKIEGWRESPLGMIYYPVYFLGGIAIHGYPSVPVRPASHGCVRIPMFAAKEFNETVAVGTRVIIHDGGPLEPRDEDPALRP
ncbi:MAG TPA: L,D-transpeptidase family protein [Blastocatellia bacterium]|jgi:lipoprotein-anchoring transpeptidase ErfK/SrfK|nr:L,D-transpeptidase family protein [Blastocatellia bacterium]